MLYRAINRLSGVADRGDLTALAHLNADQIAVLIKRGAVAPLAAPPLSELPGWERRAERLAKVGIVDAGAFLEAEPALIQKALRVKAATVESYRQEVYHMLVIQVAAPEF